MLDEDDRRKGAIMAAIRCGESNEDILAEFHISSGTLTAIKKEFGTIQTMLGELKPVSEIADSLDCSEEFIEEVRRIIETDIETLVREAEAGEEPWRPEQTEQPEKPKGKKGAGKARDIDKSLKKTGEEQAASVLVSDAGDISRDVATKRQEIGRFVMEEMGTVAAQFGYSDHKAFLQMIFEFWINNYGKLQEKDQQIAELTVVNGELQAVVDQDIKKLFIARSLDRVVIAALMGGGTLDADTLQAYKRILETINPREINQQGGEAYAE